MVMCADLLNGHVNYHARLDSEDLINILDLHDTSRVKGDQSNFPARNASLLWVEFKCPLCGKDLDDDKTMANFMVCSDKSHGLLRFFTGDGCYFTTNEKVAEDLVKKGRRVHVIDPKEFFGSQTMNLE